MSRRNGRRAWAGLAVGGATIALTSSALACVAFTGKMVVKGNAGTGQVTAVGSGNGMSWCPGYPLGRAKATLGGSVTVTVTKNTWDTCNAGLRLAAGDYLVLYSISGAHGRSDPTDKSNADGSRPWIVDCYPPRPDQTRLIGTMTIDSVGKGAGTYTLPNFGTVSGPTDEAAICLSDNFGNAGNQAPVTMI